MVAVHDAPVSFDKVRGAACPVMCFIRPGEAGACDRYFDVEGAAVRFDSHVVLERRVERLPSRSGIVDRLIATAFDNGAAAALAIHQRDARPPSVCRAKPNCVVVISPRHFAANSPLNYGIQMSSFNQERVLSVRHWTDNLFSFTTTRTPTFRFRNGEFVMMGLDVGGKPLLRAYSVASANYEDHLEFFSIKVPEGPLTSRLQHLNVGDEVVVGTKATGTLVIDNLRAGRNLFLVGTGTGLAPFLSIIKDPETYEKFEKIVLLHGCRRISELAYGEYLTHDLPKDEVLGEIASTQLVYYPTVTRDPFRNRGRITDLMTSGKLFEDIRLDPIDAANDRAMICGSPDLMRDAKAMLLDRGFEEGNHGEAGDFVVEKAFAER